MKALLFLASIFLASATFAASPPIVEIPCSHQVFVTAKGTGADLMAAYSRPIFLGEVTHAHTRSRATLGQPLKLDEKASHTRVLTESLAFEGLSGVTHQEYLTDGSPVQSSYYQHRQGVLTTWDDGMREWTRYVPTVSFPPAVDGLQFTLVHYHEGSSVVHLRHFYRWELVPSFTCPWDGKTYRDVLALVYERSEIYDEAGTLKPQDPKHTIRTATYYAKGVGPFYHVTFVGREPIGTLAQPLEARIYNDLFRTFDRVWPAKW